MNTPNTAQSFAITLAHDALYQGRLNLKRFHTPYTLSILARTYQHCIQSAGLDCDTLLGTTPNTLGLLSQLANLLSSDNHQIRWGLLSDLNGPEGAILNGACWVISENAQPITWPGAFQSLATCTAVIYPTITSDRKHQTFSLFNIDAFKGQYPDEILNDLKPQALLSSVPKTTCPS